MMLMMLVSVEQSGLLLCPLVVAFRGSFCRKQQLESDPRSRDCPTCGQPSRTRGRDGMRGLIGATKTRQSEEKVRVGRRRRWEKQEGE